MLAHIKSFYGKFGKIWQSYNVSHVNTAVVCILMIVMVQCSISKLTMRYFWHVANLFC